MLKSDESRPLARLARVVNWRALIVRCAGGAFLLLPRLGVSTLWEFNGPSMAAAARGYVISWGAWSLILERRCAS